MGGFKLIVRSGVPGEGHSYPGASLSLSHQVHCLDANLFFPNLT